MLAGITRVRNESLILEDTLRHMLSRVDHIFLYDDCSTDETVEIALSFDRITVTQGHEWKKYRDIEETRHRRMMLDQARDAGYDWAWCFDADERFVGQMPDMKALAYRFKLFDGYLTRKTCMPYAKGMELEHLPRLWGQERRDITMLFRIDHAQYAGLDQREPMVAGPVVTAQDMYVKHFGKCLSIEHWEATCDYYMQWPKYAKKWAERKGKAMHELSDFGGELLAWDEVVEKYG